MSYTKSPEYQRARAVHRLRVARRFGIETYMNNGEVRFKDTKPKGMSEVEYVEFLLLIGQGRHTKTPPEQWVAIQLGMFRKHAKAPGQRATRGDIKRWSEIVRLRRLPYREYLDTGHWEEVRSFKWHETRGWCERCGCPGKDVHHKHYETRGMETMEDVELLCETCHGRIHGILTREEFSERVKQKVLADLPLPGWDDDGVVAEPAGAGRWEDDGESEGGHDDDCDCCLCQELDDEWEREIEEALQRHEDDVCRELDYGDTDDPSAL